MKKSAGIILRSYCERLAAKGLTLSDELDTESAVGATADMLAWQTKVNLRPGPSRRNVQRAIDNNRSELAELWEQVTGVNPIAAAAQALTDAITDTDQRYIRERLDSAKFVVKTFAPTQVQRTANLNVNVGDPPAGYDYSPPMVASPGVETYVVKEPVIDPDDGEDEGEE